jgi:hypothetical protein
MDVSAWIAVIAAVIALLSGWYTAKAAKAAEGQSAEARRQTELQRQMYEDSLQPYVWADIAPDNAQGALLKLTVCNEGPTLATNIHVRFEPALTDVFDRGQVAAVQESLESGIRSLAPKRRVQWVLGVGHQFFGQNPTQSVRISITCDGPNGPCPLNTYLFDLNYIRYAHDYPDGSLHRVSERIKDLTTAVKSIKSDLAERTNDSQMDE